MSNDHTTSRRDFLTASAKAAAVAGLTASITRAQEKPSSLIVPVGPTPPEIKPDQTIRLGLVGTGGRCNQLLNAFADHLPKVTVTAISDPNEDNRDKTLPKLKDTFNAEPEVYTGEEDYRKLMARDDVDAVIIAVPCDLHARLYLDCFAAGKHFYGEKPLCIEVNEADALVEAQRRNPKVICQIGFQRRASKYYRPAIQQIHDGLIGVPFEGRGAWRIYGGPLGMPSAGTQVWFGRRKRSGDWMLEQACHTWDVMCWVAGGLPAAASGRGRRDLFKQEDPERDVTDFYVAHLEYPNGMIVDFEHNWRCPHHDEPKHFFGIFERFVGLDGGVSLAEGPQTAMFYPRDQREKPRDISGIEKKAHPTHDAVEAFLDCLRVGRRPDSTVENGRQATLTGLLVRKAVYENRRVEMREIL